MNALAAHDRRMRKALKRTVDYALLCLLALVMVAAFVYLW